MGEAEAIHRGRREERLDYVLVGGGLQASLIALALLSIRRRIRLAIVERERRLGGNHTWCFHAADLPPAARAFVAPLVVARWPGYEVRFPDRTRRVGSPYAAVSSPTLDAVTRRALAAHPGSRLVTGRAALRIGAGEVVLAGGERLAATVVVDARGPGRGSGRCGYQKFLGREVELARPHGLERPVLMDATVPQRGGFRFMYALPLGPRRLLLEDTCFSRCPDLDEDEARAAIGDYAARRGYRVARLAREERGVLPMPWSGAIAAPRAGAPLLGGYRGGWFHPATGYSFPPAVRLACFLAARAPEAVFGPDLARLHRAHLRQVRYARLLNRLLFHCFAPEEMWRAFDRFYRLPEDLIARFYALETTAADRARLLLGRPPRGLSITRALAEAIR